MSDQINQENLNPEQPEKKVRRLRSKSKKVILSVLIIIFSVFAIKGILFARHIHKFADGPGDFIIERLSENLNLDAAQIAQLEKIKDEIKAKMEANKPGKDQRESMLNEFAEEFKKDNLDRNKLKELEDRKEMKMQEMKDFMMDKIIEFHNLLTPEQRIKAADNMKEMKMKFHDRMDHFKDKKN